MDSLALLDFESEAEITLDHPAQHSSRLILTRPHLSTVDIHPAHVITQGPRAQELRPFNDGNYRLRHERHSDVAGLDDCGAGDLGCSVDPAKRYRDVLPATQARGTGLALLGKKEQRGEENSSTASGRHAALGPDEPGGAETARRTRIRGGCRVTKLATVAWRGSPAPNWIRHLAIPGDGCEYDGGARIPRLRGTSRRAHSLDGRSSCSARFHTPRIGQ